MTPKIVLGLAVAAIVSTSAAVAVWQARHTEASVAGVGEFLLPGMVDAVNDVAEIEVMEAGKRMHIKRAGENWQVLPSGYPVKPRKLQETLVSLIRLTKIEPRTSTPEKYAIIKVEDADAPGSQSRAITLKDASGGVMADVLLGKAAAGYTTGAEEAQYVRLKGDAQSWLVRGSVASGAEYKDWVDTGVVRINVNDVKDVEITQADGESLKLTKAGKNAEGHDVYVVAGLPDGIKAKDDLTVRYTATDLANVEFVAVRKVASSGEPYARATVETDKGLKVGFALYKAEDGNWLNVSVLADGNDVEAARELREKTSGWEFAVADYKAEQFEKRLSDLLDMQH